MPTVIDSLQIEIQSGSSDASRGIDALAASLEKLRSSSKTTVVVKNLQNLSAAVRGFSDASNASSAMSTLASAIERLKSVGSVASIVNNLSKLPTALKSIESVDTGRMESQFRGIAGAAGELTGIKSGGLSSMVNALSKIEKVTKDLDDTKIAAFAERVKILNEKLEPLSAKMATIKTGFSAINSGASRAAVSVQKFDHGIHTSTLNLSSFIEVAQTPAQTIQGLVQRFTEFLSQAIEWDGIAARFGRGFGSQAQETYEWIQKLNEEMHINVQQFMQYSSVYATMLTGFGVATEDAAKMALGYMELTYDIWAGYNDVYSSLEETAEAIKSAIAGEVEPVRRAGFTIVEANLQQMAEELQMEKEALRNEINNAVASGEFEQWKAQGVIAELTGKQAELNAMLSSVSDATLEQTAANHNLTFSLENATEAEKSYLRYLTMVDQAHAQGLVGTYAKEMNTAEGMMRTFNQQLKSLAQAFGSLFLPVLTKVMPYFQAFVELLEEGVHSLAAFFGVEIQKVDFSNIGVGADSMGDMAANGSDLNKEIGESVKKAKELKNAMIGIDELNVISPPSETSGSGGAGGGSGSGSGSGFGGWDVDSLWDESIFKGINDQVDSIKAKINDWLPVIEAVGLAIGALSLASFLQSIGDSISQMGVLNKILSSVGVVAIQAVLTFMFADNYLESGNLLNLIGEALVTAASGYLMFRSWGAGGLVLALGVSILTQVAAIELSLADGTVTLSSTELWVQSIFTVLTGALGGLVLSKYTAFFPKEGFVIGLGVSAALVLTGIRMGAIESGEIDSGSIEAWILEIGSIATAALAGKWLGASLFTKGGPMGALIGVTAGLVLNLVGTVEVKGEDFGNDISDWINTAITTAMTVFTASKLWGIISPHISTALTGVVSNLGGAIGTALKALPTLLASIPVWGWIAAAVVALLGGGIALAVADYDFTDVGKKVGAAIGGALKKAYDLGVDFLQWVVDAFAWVKKNFSWADVKDAFEIIFDPSKWAEAGKAIFDGLWKGIEDGWKNFKENVAEFCNGFIQGFKDAFGIASPAKKFIDIGKDIIAGLVQPLSIDTIKKKISDMWTSAKNWWDKKPKLKEYTPSIGSIYEKVKERWDNAREWYNDKKSKMKEYTPSIGSIYEKMKERWDNARIWWNDKKTAAKTYTPSIGSIKDKVVSAWNTAKTWWNNNVGGLSTKLNISVPKISVKWATASAFGKEFRYPTGFNLVFAANGGIFDAGSLIWAGERGAEIVANAGGGKTGVMNVDQMQEAVYEGVLAAMTAVMGRQGGDNSQSVNVYLDSRQITSSVERRQHEKGASILGNEVFV